MHDMKLIPAECKFYQPSDSSHEIACVLESGELHGVENSTVNCGYIDYVWGFYKLLNSCVTRVWNCNNNLIWKISWIRRVDFDRELHTSESYTGVSSFFVRLKNGVHLFLLFFFFLYQKLADFFFYIKSLQTI
jgi:hypothetical protein